MTVNRKRIKSRPAAVLIGFMGAGKSTVGKLVAELLGVDFVDADEEIVRVVGRSIPEIFAEDGAPAFRDIERRVVLDLLTRGGVVSLGGGAVMTTAIADALAEHRVVYLSIDPAEGYARAQGSDRPLLAGEDPETRYRELLNERHDTYAGLATVAVDAGAGSAEQVADAVRAALADYLIPERNFP